MTSFATNAGGDSEGHRPQLVKARAVGILTSE